MAKEIDEFLSYPLIIDGVEYMDPDSGYIGEFSTLFKTEEQAIADMDFVTINLIENKGVCYFKISFGMTGIRPAYVPFKIQDRENPKFLGQFTRNAIQNLVTIFDIIHHVDSGMKNNEN